MANSGRDFHLKIPLVLRQRLEALRPNLRIRVKRGNTNRAAHMTELFVLAAEHLAHRMEAGKDVLSGSASLSGAHQIHNGEVVSLAPMASASVYADLAQKPSVPTKEQLDALEADTAILDEGLRVVVRGTVFHTDETLAGQTGTIVSARRGKRGPIVKFGGTREIEVNPYDLVPEVLADSSE